MKVRLFVLLACLYLLLASREQPWGDAHVVYATAESLVDRGRIDVDLGGPPQFYAIRDGRKYGVFPLGNVIAHVPSYLAWKALASIPGAPKELLYRLTCHLSSSLMMAGACVLFFLLARRAGAGERAALLLSLGLGLLTQVAIFARVPYAEALQTLLLLWVFERAVAVGDQLSNRGAALLGLSCGLLLNTKLIYALTLPVVAGYVLYVHRRAGWDLLRAVGAALGPFLVLVGVALVHNHVKTGSYLDSGYSIPGGVFSGDVWAALYGFFLSPGKSIFLYSPLLLLGVLGFRTYFAHNRRHALFLLAVLASAVLVNAKFRYWHGDYTWGPRLIAPLTPLLLLPAAPWIEEALGRGRTRLRKAALVLLCAGSLIPQILGAAFYWDHYIRIAIAVKDQTGAQGWYGEDLSHCHFIPEFSPLLGHAWMLSHKVRSNDALLEDAPWKRITAAPVRLDGEWRAVRFDWWALEWLTKGGWPITGSLILVGLLAAIVLCGRGIRRGGRP